jgi:cytochrome c-type biogenesis protein CcmF
MTLGIISFVLAILANIFSFWNYLTAFQTANKAKEQFDYNDYDKKISRARFGYTCILIFIAIASFYLMYLLLSHKFQVKYVFAYTSLDLPLYYLISAFWAGQEGSFLLWLLFISAFGIIFIKSAREFEVPSMVFLNIIIFFFLIILLKANPFALLEEKPDDGLGLNPLLQNPWMVVHPPVLFAGYAAVTFPYILTLGSLVINRYKDCTGQIRSWTLISSVTLGAGIILGAYWAYGVLGWGGYWGWDPVENSSLIPWLIIIALLHGLRIQRRNKKLYRTNIILAMFAFILVIYATFLTRSGILSDFSVHSFLDLGINAYLISFLIYTIILSAVLFLKRNKLFTTRVPITNNRLNRETMLYCIIYLLLAICLFVFIGTSFPIITTILGQPAQVETSFYNRVNLPIAILIAILLGVTPFILWSPGKSIFDNKRSVTLSLLLSFFLSLTGYLMGIEKIAQLLFLFSALFAFWSNIILLFTKGLKNWRNSGVYFAHTGTGLLFTAIIVTATLSIERNILLHKNDSVNIMDYSLKYMNKTTVPGGKDFINIEIKKGNRTLLAQPKYYYNNKLKQWIREPYIHSGLMNDIYISPLKEEITTEENTVTLKKGEATRYKDYVIYFKEFKLDSHIEKEEIHVGAKLEITRNGTKTDIMPVFIFANKERISHPVPLPRDSTDHGRPVLISLIGINADDKIVQLSFQQEGSNMEYREAFFIQFSKKPLMNILWFGSFLIVLGSAIALLNRAGTPKT